ncbi:MAG TPA: PH domain-containing protein [Pyrinomonadaceae bacterium]|nr:PH domain-containing protein [Pyrinomonadaceae bacterium]
MHCMNCGRRLPPHARFCADCGTPTESDETRLAPDAEATRLAAPRPTPAPRPVQPPAPRPVTSLAVEPPPRPPARAAEEDEEQVIFTARPTMLFVGAGYVAAALGAILLMALLGLTQWDVPWYIFVPAGLALLLIPAYYHLRRNLVRFTLTDSKLVIDRGLISRTTTNIPLRNIQNVTVSASVLQRLLRFGDVVIDDANEQAAPVLLDNIPDPRHHADLLLRQLRRWR